MARSLAMATRGKQKPTIRQLCYFAGVLDSDGSIAISKMCGGQQRTKNPRYVLTVCVVNTSLDLMDWLVEKFGGRYKARRRVAEHHKTTYEWFFNNGKALLLLKWVEPLLIVKRERARLGIQFLIYWKTHQGGQGARTNDAEVARREACFTQMKFLNQLGIVQPQRLSPLAPAMQGDAIV